MSINMYWIYDLPNWLFGVLAISAFIGFGLGGLLMARHFLAHRWAHRRAQNEVISYFFAAVCALYGITLGLISVGAWQNYADTDNKAGQEASAVAALYRDMDSFPEPTHTTLKIALKDYVHFVIHESWPQQQKGIIPTGGGIRLSVVQSALYGFHPNTKEQEIIDAEAIKQFNRVTELREARLQNVKSGLPAAVWWVVVLGAAINISFSWIFVVESPRMHMLLTSLFGGLIGLLVFLMAAMDNPYRGEFSVGPDALNAVYNGLMKG